MHKPLLLISGVILLSMSFYLFHKKQNAQTPSTTQQVRQSKLFQTKKLETRTIKQTVQTNGSLQIKDRIKVGSLVSGTVKEIFVKEGDYVQKNQLLARLDNGKSDTVIRATDGSLQKALAEKTYQERHFGRIKSLFEMGDISEEAFEKASRDYHVSIAQVTIAQAEHDRAHTEYNNTHIKAPESGEIISIGIKKGMGVTTDLNATVLFIIGEDRKKMEAELEIDEADISDIRPNQRVTFSVDSYPGKIFSGSISHVSFAPKINSSDLIYPALLDVDNQDGLLRPGMTIHARIKIAKQHNSQSIDNQAFYIDKTEVEQLAQKLSYAYQPLDQKTKKSQDKNTHVKYIWIDQCDEQNNHCFIERPIRVGTHDEMHYHVIEGLNSDEPYIIDIVQDDTMAKHYKSMFKGSLS